MGDENVFDVPYGFTAGDLYKLSTKLVYDHGTRVQIKIEKNKIIVEVDDA